MITADITFDQFDARDLCQLTKVRMFAHRDLPKWPGLVELSFTEFPVYIRIEPNDDTLTCARQLSPSLKEEYSQPIPDVFWERVIGKHLTNVWQMINERGRLDAIQFEFRDSPNEGSYVTIQAYAIGSHIRLTELRASDRFPRANDPA
jgi:hypothetical protein